MMTIQPKSTLDSLPKQFVTSLRTLFDILDDKNLGFVNISDIESRWSQQDDGIVGLPKGIIEALHKVTPPNGQLSFERFVGGLKIAILRSKNEPPMSRSSVGSHDRVQDGPYTQQHRRHLISDQEMPPPPPPRYQQPPPYTNRSDNPPEQPRPFQSYRQPATLSVRPQKVAPQQRTMSMPQLNKNNDYQPHSVQHRPQNANIYQSARSSSQLPSNSVPSMNNVNPIPNKDSQPRERLGSVPARRDEQPYDIPASSRDSRSVFNEHVNMALPNKTGRSAEEPIGGAVAVRRRDSVKKREARRHTLSSGVDYNMIKRIKQLEQERDILMQGLQCAEKAKDWYHEQLNIVTEKQKYIGKSNTVDNSVEAAQERLNFQTSRIFEVNQQLQALIDSSEKGFPLHMGLAVPHKAESQVNYDPNALEMMKAQNRLLTQEVGQKSGRISILEREKAQLIREMFDARSKSKPQNYEDSTFM
ncbi:unnamed protein product [Owenia fusiformis]|uniref:Suppressor APC domain-containing protein n=1 Tax=Owenia fusiformis TaxID=6347 RepID=A0A8J1UXR2_OWEFU|nr:unnamed protein product [Owenia fusiformis]